jgi:hypothetical protein
LDSDLEELVEISSSTKDCKKLDLFTSLIDLRKKKSDKKSRK